MLLGRWRGITEELELLPRLPLGDWLADLLEQMHGGTSLL